MTDDDRGSKSEGNFELSPDLVFIFAMSAMSSALCG